MKQNAPNRRHDSERCTKAESTAAVQLPLLPFTIYDIKRIDYNSKQATFSVRFMNGALVILGEYFAPEGKPAFVSPSSIRNRYSGQYERTVVWSKELAALILETLLAMLGDAE